MRTRHSVSALALLFVLSAISGCKRQVDLEFTPNHTPPIYVLEGQVLKLRPRTGALTLTVDKEGLCEKSGFVPGGSTDQPAQCTIAKQKTFNGDEPNKYNLTVSGSDGATYEVNVIPCTGFCPLTKPCTGFCH